MTEPRRLNHDDYIIGWICPLEVEQTAALLMLDENHERLPQNAVDHNVYDLGSITGHNVVITGLPTTGKNPAATVVTQMRNTFRSLRFCLLVGIGGGVPIDTDDGPVRLGDVVVSKPTGVHSGAVQYDRGKAETGSFKRTGFLQPSPTVLLNAAQDLAVKRAIEDEDPLPKHLLRLDTKKRGLRRYKFPGRHNDHLYAPDYIHANSSNSCEKCGCDPNRRISRERGDEDEEDEEEDEAYVVVHRGTVASGELVMKNGSQRDALAKELDILCFEMEAAGAMNDFPCLVVRGISDYSDSHKHTKWHGYEAAVAAAYARQLFFHMPVDEVKRCLVAIEDIRQIKDDIGSLQQHTRDSLHQAILDWLSPIDHAVQHNDLIRRRQSGTGQWLLQSDRFRNWLNSGNATLFCPGMPGAGKTMIASIVIDHLYASYHESINVGIAYLYCNYRRGEEQRPEDLLAGLLKQLLQNHMPSSVTELYSSHKRKLTRPSIDDLFRALLTAVACYTQTFVIVDALDELTSDRTRLLSMMFDLQRKTDINIFATSRYIPDIEKAFQGSISLEIRASEEDVRRYLQNYMSELPNSVLANINLQEEIVQGITKAVDGMFLLAQLHMSSLRGKMSPKAIRTALRNLPSGSDAYDETYKVAMERVAGQVDGRRDLAIQVLSWITCAKRPLTILELRHAIAVERDAISLDEDNLPEMHDMISSCAGLVTVDEVSQIIRLVHYTTQEYFERNVDTVLPDCQTKIGHDCVVYLSFERFKTGFCSTEKEFADRLHENPFYRYAGQYWGDHVRAGSWDNDETVLKLMEDPRKVAASAQAILSFVRSKYHLGPDVPIEVGAAHIAAHFGLHRIITQLLDDGLDPNVADSDYRTALIYAARSGHAQVVDLLIKRGATVDASRLSPQSALCVASERGYCQIVMMLVEHGADVDAEQEDGNHPLRAASRNGHDQIVQVLLNKGANPNLKSYRGTRPLYEASENGHSRIVQLLLDKGAEVDDDWSRSGIGPLVAASKQGHLEIALMLLDKGARIDNRLTAKFDTALEGASRRGHTDVVKILLDRGADVSASKWALFAASRSGQEQIVHMLLKKGARDQVNSDSCALVKASEEGHDKVVQMLLDGDLNVHSGRYKSYVKQRMFVEFLEYRIIDAALEHAANGGHNHIVRRLLHHGANPNSLTPRMGEAKVPMTSAAERGHDQVTRILLDNGADPNLCGPDGIALGSAAFYGHDQVVRILLDSGADPNLCGANGTALELAAHRGHDQVVRILLDNGADPNLCGPNGTALELAAYYGHDQVVRILLDSGADPNACVSDGRDALASAVSNGHGNIEQMLLDAGAEGILTSFYRWVENSPS